MEFKMSRMTLLTVLFLILLWHVDPSYGQLDFQFPHNYNLPHMIAKISSVLSTSQDIRSIRDDLDTFSTSGQNKDPISDGAFKGFLENFLSNSDKDRCNQDIGYILQNLQANDTWALKMLDAFGKPESGVLEGNVKWYGNYHECLSIYAPPNENSTAGDFNGQYCTMDLRVGIMNKTLPISLGVCLPHSCESAPAESFKVPQMFSNVNITRKTCQPISKKVTSSAIGMIFLLSFFVLLALIGSSITVYDYIMKWNKQKDPVSLYITQEKDGDMETRIQDSSTNATLVPDKEENRAWGTAKEFFNCFCILTNGEKLLNTDNTEGQLLCLHGIRFLSMTWVIVCHTYGMIVLGLSNVLETAETIDTWLFQIILNGHYCVDSFFLLSGFLMSHLYFQESAKTNGKVPWLYFYIHRFVRLTPVYMIVLGIHTTLFYYMGSGPLYPTNEIEPICRYNWWYNILYINNFAPHAKQCMPWTWYLANDMQFFVVSPIILISLWRWPKIGYSVLGLIMSATIGANIGITIHYNLQDGYGAGNPNSALNMDMQDLMEQQNTFYEHIYIKPYTRMSAYLVGIALAYYLFIRKRSNAGKLSQITLACGWIVAAAITLTCQFYLYHRKLSVVETGFYEALGHACFTCGLGWVIFTCLNGQAGPVNSILSFKLFIPLSRLTYSAYLIHVLVVSAYFQALKTTFQFSHITVVIVFLGLLVITYALSFVVSVLFESPVIRLDKFARNKLKS